MLPECTADGGGGGRFPGDAGRLLSVLLPVLMPLRRAADTLSEFFTSDHSDFCFFSFFRAVSIGMGMGVGVVLLGTTAVQALVSKAISALEVSMDSPELRRRIIGNELLSPSVERAAYVEAGINGSETTKQEKKDQHTISMSTLGNIQR